MTLFLTPDLNPFFGGTYFPKVAMYGRPSFRQLLERVRSLWQDDRDALIDSGRDLTSAIIQSESSTAREIALEGPAKWLELCTAAYQYFDRAYDELNGGFGSAPKFPRPVQFDFLLNYSFAVGGDRSRRIALSTLLSMAEGGIHDQVGGGFHRYSVDERWLVPHFEKMLYDQAQLLNS